MKKALILCSISIWCLKIQAQNQLTCPAKNEIINNLCKSLLDNYIFEDTAVNMKNSLLKSLTTGLYDSITNPQEFAQKLTQDLRSVYNDVHLSVIYNPQQTQGLSDTTSKNASQNHRSNLEEARTQNFGFKKAEILSGNIGYVYFDRFYPATEEAKATIQSVFNFLKNTNALIIDIRNNGGGDAGMVSYICSFLFARPTHITDVYERKTNKTQSYYTNVVTGSEFFSNKPIYVLTNRRTFSAAEGFAYALQSQRRVQIIGEATGGGAHLVSPQLISNGFIGLVPYARAIDPVTKTNWEAIGVKPNVNALSDNAQDAALLIYYDYEIANLKDSATIKKIQWARTILDAKIHPYEIDTSILKNYTGRFGDEIFSYTNGALYVKGKKGAPFYLIPLSQTSFKPADIDYYKFEFLKNAKGHVDAVVITYDDGFTRTDKKEE